MAYKVSEVNEKSDGPVGVEVGTGVGVDEEGADGAADGGTEDEGALKRLPLAFLGPLKVTVGSSRF